MKLSILQLLIGVSLSLNTKSKSRSKRTPASEWFPLPRGIDLRKPHKILRIIKEEGLEGKESLGFTHIAFFGDSSCDTHSLFDFTNHTTPESPEYWKGRVSDGPMWPDYLKSRYNLRVKNRAYSNSVVLNSNIERHVPDFPSQIKEYEKRKFRDPKRLAIISFAGNDLLRSDITSVKLASDIEEQVQYLFDKKLFKYFLVIESPSPYFNEKGYSQALKGMANRLRGQNNGLFIDTYPVIDHYIDMIKTPPPTADPGNWHGPGEFCYEKKIKPKCSDPQNYLLFDRYHLSTIPNYNLARHIAKKIQSLEWVQY